MNDLDTHLNKDRLFEQSATVYFDMLSESGKPPVMRDVYSRLSDNLGLEKAVLKNMLSGPEFDEYMRSRRENRVQKELALKLLAAEFAEKIQDKALSRLVDLLENPDSKISTKDLIAAAHLASELNAQVDQTVKQVTGSNDININIKFRDMVAGLPVERRVAWLGEVMRMGTAPVMELEDGSSSEE